MKFLVVYAADYMEFKNVLISENIQIMLVHPLLERRAAFSSFPFHLNKNRPEQVV